MSRSFGARCVTSRSPIRISPPVTFSNPANARSDVDLPHPDGPTSTRNSPSAIARSRPVTEGRSAPGYWMVTLSYVMAAIGGRPLRIAGDLHPLEPWHAVVISATGTAAADLNPLRPSDAVPPD